MEEPRLSESPLYNSRIINSFILLIKHKYSYVNISELLNYAGMKEYEVADQAHWFRQEQVDRFYERLVQVTGNPKIAREAGRHAASPDVLGAMRQYVLGLVDAASTFDFISKTTAKFTRSASYQSRPLSSNSVEIVVKPYQQGLEKPYQCENRIGFFEAIVLIFNHKITDLQYFPDQQHLPVIQHPECFFQGGEQCRYIVTWEKALYISMKKVRNLAGIFLAFFVITLAVAGLWSVLAAALPASLCIFLLLALISERGEKGALKASLRNTRDSVENLLEQIDVNYNNAMLSNELGQRLGSYRRVADMLPAIADVMQRRLYYDRGIILLPNREGSALEVGTSFGYSEGELGCLAGLPFPLQGGEGSGDVYLECFREQRPFLVNDLEREGAELGPRTLSCARSTGTRAFICCPIVCEGMSLGVLAVENVKEKKPLVERDISLMMGVSSVIGISIRNSELIRALEEVKEELELRVARRTEDLERSRRRLQLQHEELERTYHDLEEETAARVEALEELREKERLLLQQSRLAALGEMISNIAHQWRQPLNELGLIVQELPMMYDQGNFSRDYLRGSVAKFMKVLAHTSKTIDDFRNFFKPDKEKVRFAVRQVVEQTLSLIEESFRNLQIRVTVEGDAATIDGYPNEFAQVILNILFNSRDAFQERNPPHERVVRIAISGSGGRTVLTVTDNAGGIPEEIMERIFDPYFTTRGPSKGTGIGLYMSKIIIEKNIPGTLSVRNTGDGAEFRIEVAQGGNPG